MAIDRNFTNGFRAMRSLERAAQDSRVEEIEGAGMDAGRVFVHLTDGYIFQMEGTHLRSVGSAAELRAAMADIVPCTCEGCVDGLARRAAKGGK
jgi:hypothetical protein